MSYGFESPCKVFLNFIAQNFGHPGTNAVSWCLCMSSAHQVLGELTNCWMSNTDSHQPNCAIRIFQNVKLWLKNKFWHGRCERIKYGKESYK